MLESKEFKEYPERKKSILEVKLEVDASINKLSKALCEFSETILE